LTIFSIVFYAIIGIVGFIIFFGEIYFKALNFLGIDLVELNKRADQPERAEELIVSKIRERIGLSLWKISRLFREFANLYSDLQESKRDREYYGKFLNPAFKFERIGREVLEGKKVKFHYEVESIITGNLRPEGYKYIGELENAVRELRRLAWVNKFLFFFFNSGLDIYVNIKFIVRNEKTSRKC